MMLIVSIIILSNLQDGSNLKTDREKKSSDLKIYSHPASEPTG